MRDILSSRQKTDIHGMSEKFLNFNHTNCTTDAICVRLKQACREKLREQSCQVLLVFVNLRSNYNRFCEVVLTPIVQFLYFHKNGKKSQR